VTPPLLEEAVGGWAKKKEYRCTPTFVNLKSNTMKNTVQRYGLFGSLQIIGHKKAVL
jgi:hypothetical protein